MFVVSTHKVLDPRVTGAPCFQGIGRRVAQSSGGFRAAQLVRSGSIGKS